MNNEDTVTLTSSSPRRAAWPLIKVLDIGGDEVETSFGTVEAPPIPPHIHAGCTKAGKGNLKCGKAEAQYFPPTGSRTQVSVRQVNYNDISRVMPVTFEVFFVGRTFMIRNRSYSFFINFFSCS